MPRRPRPLQCLEGSAHFDAWTDTQYGGVVTINHRSANLPNGMQDGFRTSWTSARAPCPVPVPTSGTSGCFHSHGFSEETSGLMGQWKRAFGPEEGPV